MKKKSIRQLKLEQRNFSIYDITISERAKNGDFDAVKSYVENGGDINDAESSYYGSPLSAATMSYSENLSRVKIINYLLEKGADVNIPCGEHGDSPLANVIYWATNEYDVEDEEHRDIYLDLVKKFIDAGADVNYVNEEGDSVLEFAIFCTVCFGKNELIDPTIINLLMDAGASAKTTKGGRVKSPLEYVIEKFSPERKCARQVIDCLLEHGASFKDINLPIMVYNQKPEVVEYILEHGGDANSTGAGGRTLLMEAIEREWQGIVEGKSVEKEMLEVLIKHGADVNAQTDFGKTALHEAAFCGSLVAAKILIEAGADVNLDSEDGTPLDVAIEAENPKIAAYLKEHGAEAVLPHKKSFPVEKAEEIRARPKRSKKELQELFQWFKDYGYGYPTPELFGFIRDGDLEAVMVAHEAGVNMEELSDFTEDYEPDVPKTGNDYTPLGFAVDWGRLEIVKYLVEECGVDVNKTGKGGFSSKSLSPLDLAINGRHTKIEDYLRSKGAKSRYD